MPIYEYECAECGEELERYEPYINRQDAPNCECGAEMQKCISASWAQHWGEGSYATLHGSQWRNKWGKKFYHKNEGENFSATDNTKAVTGKGHTEHP